MNKYKIKFELLNPEIEIDFNDYFPGTSFTEDFIESIIKNEIAPSKAHISIKVEKVDEEKT